MKEIPVSSLDTSDIFEKIGKQWMLITAVKDGVPNTMTASWGSIGVLWRMNTATCYIRPTRHTYGFAETADTFTLSFFDEAYRAALNLCGTKSGRDCDKIAEAGLTPILCGSSAYFAESKLVLFCRKLFAQTFTEDSFTDKKIISDCYPKKDFHKMYVGEIVRVLIQD